MRNSRVTSVLALVAAFLPFARTGAAQSPRVVTVKAYDYRFEAPARVPAGTITFRMENDGKELHHLWIVKLTGKKTPDDFTKVMKTWGSALKMPEWAIDVGGPNSASPGTTAEGTMTLDPGTYMLVCWVPSPDGMLHVMKGMVKPMTITARPAGQPADVEPTADITMTLDDYTFDLSKPITPGRHVIRVENRAPQTHEVVIARLNPGQTAGQALVWINAGQSGPGPVVLGGASGIAKGRHMFITVDFQPGHYALFCFIPDVKDGKPHTNHGMLKELTVGAEASKTDIF
jgi:uncharacterized cupredoxin-like copper-binding protein